MTGDSKDCRRLHLSYYVSFNYIIYIIKISTYVEIMGNTINLKNIFSN